MSKKIILSLLTGVLMCGFSSIATAQNQKNPNTDEAVVKVATKEKAAERRNPEPQAVQTKASANPIRAPKTVEQEVKELKRVIAHLEAKTTKLPFEEQRLVRLKKELAEKEK
jgi:uncharacterized low-complexity protein